MNKFSFFWVFAILLVACVPSPLQQLKQRASTGDVIAEYKVGEFYYYGGTSQYTGNEADKNFPEALIWLQKSAEQGYAPAEYLFGVMLLGEQNYEYALLWINKAARQGYTTAEYKLGEIYREGIGLSKDDHKSALWFEKAQHVAPDSSQSFPIYDVHSFCQRKDNFCESYEQTAYNELSSNWRFAKGSEKAQCIGHSDQLYISLNECLKLAMERDRVEALYGNQIQPFNY